MAAPATSTNAAAALIARFLVRRGVDRIFGLCGGHIMPIWMACDAAGIRIIDVRDERAAVHMAHAHAELTDRPSVALVTAGPGVTNAITGIANAHVARAPVLVLSGLPPRDQENRGALQDMVHTDLLRSITRYARTVREASAVLRELDAAYERALGAGGEPGPVYLDFPTDVLRADVPAALQLEEHLAPRHHEAPAPNARAIERAVDILWHARRPLVIAGRGARRARDDLPSFLNALGALYLDTGEARGIVPDAHPSVVNAMRATVMSEADVVVTLGRKLDFQLAYGSPAVFRNATFVRIGDATTELIDNRRGAVEIHADVGRALRDIVAVAGERTPSVDRAWTAAMRERHDERGRRMRETMRDAPADAQGRMHPHVLLSELDRALGVEPIVIADGGDFLSFARVALSPAAYLDPGSLGCLGVGVPFGIAASLARPDRVVAVLTGDGAFGFNAIEIDTAVRHGARLLIVVANNGAWQIEVDDQLKTYGKVVGTRLQFADHAAMARAFGMHGERVTHPQDLPGAIERALAHRPALLDVVVSPQPASADARSGLAWVPDLQPLAAWDEAERHWRAAEPPV